MIMLALALAVSVPEPKIVPLPGAPTEQYLPSGTTAGQLFDAMDNGRQATTEKICEMSFDAYQRGDKDWLQRYFAGTPTTPMPMQLLITKMCSTYGAGIIKGMKNVGEILNPK